MAGQEQEALARMFGVGELAEVVVMPLELLRKIARACPHVSPDEWEEGASTTGP